MFPSTKGTKMNLLSTLNHYRKTASVQGSDKEVLQHLLEHYNCRYDADTGSILKTSTTPEKLIADHIAMVKTFIGKPVKNEGETTPEEELKYLEDPTYRAKRLRVLMLKNPITETVVSRNIVNGTPYTRFGFVNCPTSHLVWMLEHGTIVQRVRAIDGDISNTHISNLKSGGSGAGSVLKPHQCVVVYGGRQYHLGRFETKEQVQQARDEFRFKKSIGLI